MEKHPSFDWISLIESNFEEAVIWAGASSFLRRPMPGLQQQFDLHTINSLSCSSPRARLFQAILTLTHAQTEDAARIAHQRLMAVDDASGIRRWHFLALLWGLAIVQADNEKFRALLLAGQARGLSRHLATAITKDDALRDWIPAYEPRRVAVVAPHLSHGRHPPTRLALEHTALLARSGTAVQLFAAQDFSELQMASWLGTDYPMHITGAATESWTPRIASPAFDVHMSDPLQPVPCRWQQTLSEIDAFKPDAVLYVGFCSPLLDLLHARFPVAALSVHSCQPIGQHDVWLHGWEKPEAMAPPWEANDDCEPFYYPFRLPPEAIEPDTVVPFGLDDGRPTLVTVGHRLGIELTPEWTNHVIEILSRNPEWRWLLVGQIINIPAVLENNPQIFCVGHHSNVSTIVRNCSLYLNPPRMGGGFSIIEAMSLGIPVVSLSSGDGGQKLGPQAAENEEIYWRQMVSLMSDAEARGRCAELQRARYQGIYNLENAEGRLQQALALACARRRARL